MKDKINGLIKELEEVKALSLEMGDLTKARNLLANELEPLKVQLADVKKQLAATSPALSLAQNKALKEFEEASFAKRKELEGITAEVDKARTTLADLISKINSARGQHDQIEASLQSLRARLG